MNMQVCTACGISKPHTSKYFYARNSKTGALMNQCKECRTAYQRKRNKLDKTPNGTPGRVGEQIVIDALNAIGIVAAPGKQAMRGAWYDVIAWGCVVVEVKQSSLTSKGYGLPRFGFTLTNMHRSDRKPHIIALVCDWPDSPTSIHLFDANDPVFYHEGGKMKTGIAYTPRSRLYFDSGSHLTDECMNNARERWSLIEQHRVSISMQLMQQAKKAA